MGKTRIEWSEEVWNPVVGCTKVSAGCRNCYAERIYERFHPGQKFSEVRCLPGRLDAPLHWRKPRRVFVNSMSDLFHEDVPIQFFTEIYRSILMNYQHTFIVLTKRPERMVVTMKTVIDLEGFVLDNLWLGVSVEDQDTADRRIPLLLQTPAAMRFVSVEPMLGPVDLPKCFKPEDEDWEEINNILDANGDCEPEEFIEECEEECDWINYGNNLVVSSEWREWISWRKWRAERFAMGRKLDWVIVGGESGPKARPMKMEWLRSVVEQCKETGVPVFVKQDSGLRPGRQGRIPDELWIKEYP